MRRLLGFLSWVVIGGAAACAAGGASGAVEPQRPLAGMSPNDRARCAFRGRADREVQELATLGAPAPNVRRVFGVVGSGEEQRRVLLCRETDTNLDGIKDVVRTYDDQGEPLSELSDADYDGRIDTWLTFAKGKVQRAEFDRDGDGKPDEVWKYVEGRVSRIERDTNGDGRPDVFEVYVEGSLERIGVDVDGDGTVDRWDRSAPESSEETSRSAPEPSEETEGEL